MQHREFFQSIFKRGVFRVNAAFLVIFDLKHQLFSQRSRFTEVEGFIDTMSTLIQPSRGLGACFQALKLR